MIVCMKLKKPLHKLHQDGNGRIRIADLEATLQRVDEDNRSKPGRKTQVRKFSE